MPQKKDLQKQIAIHNRRLQLLEERRALRGFDTPPDVIIEIEDIEAKLEALQAELKGLENPDIPIAPVNLIPNAAPRQLTASQRRRLTERRDELQEPLATYNRRIKALRSDIARELDGERRAVLEERLEEVKRDWEKVQSELEDIERQLQ